MRPINNEMRRDDTLRASLHINSSTRYAYCNSYFFSLARVKNHRAVLQIT